MAAVVATRGRMEGGVAREAREHGADTAHLRVIVIVASLIAAILLALGIYWSREPAPFDVAASVHKTLRQPIAQPVTGAVTTATLVRVVVTLLDKPGGFTNNDIAPPGVWLDNMPSWERGALQQARDMMRALRDDFGRVDADTEPMRIWRAPSRDSNFLPIAGCCRHPNRITAMRAIICVRIFHVCSKAVNRPRSLWRRRSIWSVISRV